MRKLSQLQVMETVIKNWRRQEPPDGSFAPSVRGTAWFLWVMVVGLLLLGGLAAIVAWFPKPKEHCDHRTWTGTHMECAQDLQADAGRKGQDVVHARSVDGLRHQEYVHGDRP
jgi:hypothetical protein